MSWDKSSKPKRLRRKHKRIIILVALVGSMSIVVVTGLWNSFMQEDYTGIMSSILNGDGTQADWANMSDEEKAAMMKLAK